MKKSAGIVIIKDKKILLCHPTNSSWNGTFSFPKGQLDKNETPKEAAIRETFEEVGIKFDDITSKEEVIEYIDGNGKIYKKVYYYIVESSELSNIIDKEQLQLN